jgi:hypothetical protein
VIWPNHEGIIATPIILGRRRLSLEQPRHLEALTPRFAPSNSSCFLSSPNQPFANVVHGIAFSADDLVKAPIQVSSRC